MLINVVLLCFILPLPIRKLHKQNMLNYLVSKLAKSTLYAGIHVKKGVVDGHKLDYSKPAIIIANHSSFLDILAVLMLHPKTVIFVKKWVYQSPVFGFFIRFGGYLFAEDGSDENSHLVEERLAAGYSVVIFPEGKRSADGQIHRFHKGAFYLSKALNVPIQPVLILGTHEVNPRNDFMINEGQIWLKALDRISCGDDESYKAYCLRATNLMRSAMLDFRHDYAGTAFYRRKVMENFLFKGPILEWYVRVKWMLEHKNFDVYNQLIGSRKSIVDIGCGYGYLSLFLHYHNSNRIVLGLDYDEEKIAVASNAIAYSENLTFAAVDIRQFDFSPTDVFFFNDVLHYLNPEEQQAVLQRAVDTLLPGGILFIRDGIEELSIKHKNTKRTEELSTKFFKFNKTTNELHFLSAVSIEHFANTNGLGFELVEHSTKTSNVLMILRKP
jgi:1-acyl-sn-glycerol-3-phosphate acyltransferase